MKILQETYGRLARRVDRFVKWRARRERARCMKSIREQLAFFGIDTSDMTDEEVEEHVRYAGKQIAKCGVTAQQAADGLRAAGRIFATT